MRKGSKKRIGVMIIGYFDSYNNGGFNEKILCF